jgi:hypothetical protein
LDVLWCRLLQYLCNNCNYLNLNKKHSHFIRWSIILKVSLFLYSVIL